MQQNLFYPRITRSYLLRKCSLARYAQDAEAQRGCYVEVHSLRFVERQWMDGETEGKSSTIFNLAAETFALFCGYKKITETHPFST